MAETMLDRLVTNGVYDKERNRYLSVKLLQGDPIMVFNIQNVAEYYWNELETKGNVLRDQINPEDFPNIAPPFQLFWFEYRARNFIAMQARALGVDLPTRTVTTNVGIAWQAYDLKEVEQGMDSTLRESTQDLWRGIYSGIPSPHYSGELLAGYRKQLDDDPTLRVPQLWESITQFRSSVGRMALMDEAGTRREQALHTVFTAAALRPFVPVRWLLRATVFIEAKPGVIMSPAIDALYPLSEAGQQYKFSHGYVTNVFAPNLRHAIQDESLKKIPEDATEAEKEEIIENTTRRTLGVFMNGFVSPALMALSFLHCKNIAIESHEPPAKLNRARQKRGKKPLTRWHTLHIEPMKKVIRTEGNVEQNGLKRALHIVRGHFVTYDEKPLFGRVRGTFWRDMHVRGSETEGIVGKDYAVHTPTPTEERSGTP